MHLKTHAIIDFMNANIDRNITLAHLALYAKLSPSHICYLFKKDIGASPLKLLKQLRLEKACYLLQSTLLNIKEIRSAVGFNDESHFMRDFKMYYGLTPSQYRRQYRA